jgi:hypothetical protein
VSKYDRLIKCRAFYIISMYDYGNKLQCLHPELFLNLSAGSMGTGFKQESNTGPPFVISSPQGSQAHPAGSSESSSCLVLKINKLDLRANLHIFPHILKGSSLILAWVYWVRTLRDEKLVQGLLSLHRGQSGSRCTWSCHLHLELWIEISLWLWMFLSVSRRIHD